MKKLLFVILALVTVMALASCDIDGILESFMDQLNGFYQEDENQNSEDKEDNTDPEKPNTDPEKPNTDPEKPNTDPEKPGNDDNYSEGLEYTLDINETSYKVTDIGTCTDKDIKIPPTYNGKPVTGIAAWAFDACLSLTRVTIPDSVTSIGHYAFYNCTSLTSITIGNSVTLIDDYVFDDCQALTTVYYTGTEAEWAKIIINSHNSNLTSATRYYYSETEPTTVGNYWHYDENGEIAVW